MAEDAEAVVSEIVGAISTAVGFLGKRGGKRLCTDYGVGLIVVVVDFLGYRSSKFFQTRSNSHCMVAIHPSLPLPSSLSPFPSGAMSS